MNRLRMSAAGAILLAADLSYRLTGWAYFVEHSVLALAFSELCPDYYHLFLRYPDRLVAPRTEITAHFETSNDKTVLWARQLFSNARASDP